MPIEEAFRDLCDQYGEDFNWRALPPAQDSFVAELKAEIGPQHFPDHAPLSAVAKCDANDDVLFFAGHEAGEDIYDLVHLTYSRHNAKGFPAFRKSAGIARAKEYIARQHVLHNL